MCPCTTIHHVNVMLGERNSIALLDRSSRREVGLVVTDAATLAYIKKNTPLAVRGSCGWMLLLIRSTGFEGSARAPHHPVGIP
jgi:hypothetical protein